MTRRSSIRPTRSSASTPPRSAAPTCTSSRATCRRRCPGRSSATRRSAPCSRSARPSARVAPGDRVLLSCVSSCGRCRYCKEARYGQCLGGGGWIFGHTINGVQAEFARVPFADNSVYKFPETLGDEQVLFLADILPTAFEVGVLNGAVSPGDVVAIVGAGPDRPLGDPHREALHARPYRRHRSCRQPAGERAALRRGHHDQQRARGRGRARDGAHRRSRRRRRARGGRRAGRPSSSRPS